MAEIPAEAIEAAEKAVKARVRQGRLEGRYDNGMFTDIACDVLRAAAPLIAAATAKAIAAAIETEAGWHRNPGYNSLVNQAYLRSVSIARGFSTRGRS